MRNEFSAIIEAAAEGGYWATCPEVLGANGQGETVEEVLADLVAAIELMLEYGRERALKSASPGARHTTVVVG
jgi:predicted RNase H-like HicB family nuclease